MGLGQVLLDDPGARIATRHAGEGSPLFCCTGDGAAACLRREIVLRLEVTVKTAVRQAGRLHEIGDADPVKAVLAEQLARNLEDAFPVGGCLLPADLHAGAPACDPSLTPDIYSPCKINNDDNRHLTGGSRVAFPGNGSLAVRYKVFRRHAGLRVSELVLGAGSFGTRRSRRASSD